MFGKKGGCAHLTLSGFSLCSHPNAGLDRPATAVQKCIVFRVSFCGGEDRGDFAPLSRNRPKTETVTSSFIYIDVVICVLPLFSQREREEISSMMLLLP